MTSVLRVWRAHILSLALGMWAGFGLAQAPGDFTDVRVVSSLRVSESLDAGASADLEVVLENGGTAAARAEVEVASFSFGEHGDERSAAPGAPYSNATWLSVASDVPLGPGQQVTVPVTVNVPDDARPGTYWSRLLVAPSDAGSVRTDTNEEGVRTSVRVRMQYGITVLTHVGQPSDVDLQFRDPAWSGSGDGTSYALEVTLGNPTRFLATPEVWLELYDETGTFVTEVVEGDVRVYPEAGKRVRFDLGALEEGAYQAVIVADMGDEGAFGVRYDLEAGTP